MKSNDYEIRSIDDWVFCQWNPRTSGPHPLLLLLHGFTGDEFSMSIFVNRLPENFLLVSPRGIFVSPLGGYSWEQNHPGDWSDAGNFIPSAEALFEFLSSDNFPTAKLDTIHLMGFSQGAALAYVMAVIRPSVVAKVAGISGFMPDRIDSLIENEPLQGKRIFVAHGKRDDLIPLEKAEQAVETLRRGGAVVNYCEEDVGHKLSASCFRGIESYFKS
jgi:phospholipase/carboxylesterase